MDHQFATTVAAQTIFNAAAQPLEETEAAEAQSQHGKARHRLRERRSTCGNSKKIIIGATSVSHGISVTRLGHIRQESVDVDPLQAQAQAQARVHQLQLFLLRQQVW
jgi:hypothetical protein